MPVVENPVVSAPHAPTSLAVGVWLRLRMYRTFVEALRDIWIRSDQHAS